MAPSFAMVSKYFIASVVSFVAFGVLLLVNYYDIVGHHFQPKLLALTHIATLGWISMIIFGAMFQLVPVILEVKLHNEKLGEIQFWIYCIGIIGMVYGFYTFSVGTHFTASAALVTAAMFLFIYNIFRTMMKVTKWNITGLFLIAALIYLAITALSGLILGYNLGFPFINRIHFDYLKIHAHIGFIGWVLMVIMGVGLKLIPMFGLSHNYSTVPAKIAFIAVNIGLLGTSIEWFMTGPAWLLKIYIVFLIFGLFAFIVQIVMILKNRLKLTLDIGMKHSVVGFGYAVIATLLGGLLAFSPPNNESIRESTVLAYGLIIMVGFFSMLIVGQMYKIVPFLVWFHTFSDRAGKEKVPLLKDLLNETLASIQFGILNAGILVMIGGTVLSNQTVQLIGFALFTISAILFAYNIGNVFYIRVRDDNRGQST
jgi:hypothetical protein